MTEQHPLFGLLTADGDIVLDATFDGDDITTAFLTLTPNGKISTRFSSDLSLTEASTNELRARLSTLNNEWTDRLLDANRRRRLWAAQMPTDTDTDTDTPSAVTP